MNNLESIETSTAVEWLKAENLMPKESAEVLDETKAEDIYAIMWPEQQHERVALTEMDEVDKVLVASPAGAIIQSDKTDVYRGLHHDYANKVPENSEGFFNLEYSWAVMDDIFREAGKDDEAAQIRQIREIGKTSETLLRPGGVAIYDMKGAHLYNDVAEQNLGKDYAVESAERLYADLFQEELDGSPFTGTEVRNRGEKPYSNSTIFLGYMPE